jgi:hypothetical protein
MRGRLRLRLVSALALVSAAVVGLPTPSALAAHGPAGVTKLGKPWQPPKQPAPDRKLAVLGAGASAAARQIATAGAQARQSGRPVAVAGLTTQTTTVTALPNGTEVTRVYVLPVRVKSGRTWVPVSTALRRVAGGRLAPRAIPNDEVTFSAGGTGPAAVISADGTRLALWWPDPLPAPKVAGAAATYSNVLPGVDLVLTATSAQAGGFSEVLVVRTAAAARDPGLRKLTLRVATYGTAPLQTVPGGGMAAAMAGGRGEYTAAPSTMWDSSRLAPGRSLSAPGAGWRAAAATARAGGMGLTAPGSGPATSSPTGAAAGALVAPVRASLTAVGRVLSLLPDARMLTSPDTRFPVFIDPGFTTITGTGNEQAFDPVQSDCTGSHYNDSKDYPDTPVGFDDWQQSSCGTNSTDYSLYQVGIPSGVFGADAVLIDASFQTDEVYSSICPVSGDSYAADVTASWIGGINKNTGWPGPGKVSDDHDATLSVAADSGSCSGTADFSKKVAAGFNVTADLNAISGAPSNITFRLWETNSSQDTNDIYLKQFSDNPDLQVVYTETPNNPGNLKEAANSGGTGSLDCDTNKSDPNLPRIGKTDSVSGVYLDASYSIDDSSTVQGNIKYWYYPPGSSTATDTTTKDAAVNDVNSTSTEYGWQLPGSYTSGLANGSIVAWQAQAETGSGSVDSKTWGPYSSSWVPASSACYFAVYPTAPDAPTLAPSGFTQTASQSVASQIKFTITQSSGDTASEFVWGLDSSPPTTGTIPAAQTCLTTKAEPACTEISGGVATLTITVPSPGPHDLWVYEIDSGGNDSGTTNGAAANQSWTFSGAGDPGCSATNPSACYTSGTSLQANFLAALGASESYDNTMISTESGSSGSANGDGGGKSFDEQQLKNAGWNPGGTVTIDGTSFSLPSFGSSTSGPDNLLAADQTIGTGSAGASGSALVFLATATSAVTQVGGLASDSPDSGLLYPGDATAPAVMGGTPVAGDGCTNVLQFNPTTTGTGICLPATGNIDYSGTGCPSQQQYTLTVPDWVEGPSDIAALTMPDRDTTTTQQADSPKIYAFAVPLDASCTVTSVTLPDVGASVLPTVGAGGVTAGQPGLHIFGMSLRNTTTGTPEATGTQAASPAGQAWTGAFESPIEDAFAQTSSGNETVRIAVSTNVAVPAGAQIRIRLSYPGFTAGDNAGPLQIGAASVATAFYQAIPGQTPVPLTFGSGSSVYLPEGGDIYSNPLTLPFSWSPGQGLFISLWLENASLTYLPTNAWPSGGFEYLTAANAGNETEDTTGTPFTSWTGGIAVLSGVDVTTPAATIDGIASPGAPTVVVAGNNVIDGWTSGNKAWCDCLNDPSQRLAGQLASQGLTTGYGTVDAGLAVNQVLADLPIYGGMSLLSRLDRDVLAEPDVGTVIIDQGLQDVLTQGGTATNQNQLENAYTVLEGELSAFGVNVITADLTPCGGYSSSASTCSTTVDDARQAVNSFIDDGGGAPNCPAFFDQAVGNGAGPPEALQTAYDAGDHVNLSAGSTGGYAALAPAVENSGCILTPNATPLP